MVTPRLASSLMSQPLQHTRELRPAQKAYFTDRTGLERFLFHRTDPDHSVGVDISNEKKKKGQPSNHVTNGALGHVTTAALKREANGQCRSS